jgi:hypothetical protein
MDRYSEGNTAPVADALVRPGSVTDTKQNLTNRVQSLADAVQGLRHTLETGGLLRPEGPSAPGQKDQVVPPSIDSALSQHLADLGKRVGGLTNEIERITEHIDV